MKTFRKYLIFIGIAAFASVAYFMAWACSEQHGTESKGTKGSPEWYIDRINNARKSDKISVKNEIQKEVSDQLEKTLDWLKTRELEGMLPLKEDATEVLAVQLLADIKWFGATDFFIDHISWHTVFSDNESVFTPKWQYFVCAIALTQYDGCQLKIAHAIFSAKREIEVQLLCIVLLNTMKEWESIKELLEYSGSEEDADRKRLDDAIKSGSTSSTRSACSRPTRNRSMNSKSKPSP